MLPESNMINSFFAASAALISAFWLWHIVASKLAEKTSYRFMCAMTGLFMGVFSLHSIWDMVDHLMYDDDTPFVVITDYKLLTPTISPGERAVVHYNYYKRPGCEGNVSYRIKEIDGEAGGIVLENTMTAWPSGEGKAKSYFSIPDNIKPGDYYLYWIVSGECEKVGSHEASSPRRKMRFRAPMVPVKVINKGT